jgi:hypothetical protein
MTVLRQRDSYTLLVGRPLDVFDGISMASVRSLIDRPVGVVWLPDVDVLRTVTCG